MAISSNSCFKYCLRVSTQSFVALFVLLDFWICINLAFSSSDDTANLDFESTIMDVLELLIDRSSIFTLSHQYWHFSLVNITLDSLTIFTFSALSNIQSNSLNIISAEGRNNIYIYSARYKTARLKISHRLWCQEWKRESAGRQTSCFIQFLSSLCAVLCSLKTSSTGQAHCVFVCRSVFKFVAWVILNLRSEAQLTMCWCNSDLQTLVQTTLNASSFTSIFNLCIRPSTGARNAIKIIFLQSAMLE